MRWTIRRPARRAVALLPIPRVARHTAPYPVLRTALVAASLILGLGACKAEHFNGVRFDPPEPAPDVTLTRADGSTFSLREQRGSVVLVFFGYTHCPDICPTTLSDWKKVKRALGSDADDVKFVFITVDPDRDTPAVAQQYVNGFDRSFIGLSGDSAQIAAAEAAFHVTATRDAVPAANGYTMTHAAMVFAVDRKNRVRLLYPFGIAPESVTDDVKKLLRNA